MLENASFIIPVQIDSKDRARNLYITVDYIVSKFPNSPIIVTEQYGEFCADILKEFKNQVRVFAFHGSKNFSRSQHFNFGTHKAPTTIVIHQDCDIIMPQEQYEASVELIQDGFKDGVIPYNGITWEISSSDIEKIYPHYDFKFIKSLNLTNITPPVYQGPTRGGIGVHRKETFIQFGMWNENFKGWGGEDDELHDRLIKLGYRLDRVAGDIFHMQHYRGTIGYGNGNVAEYSRVMNKSIDDLKKEIQSWKWLQENYQREE